MSRWSKAETINLFSFQDIMASVIGVLFFVVLMLSLDMVKQQESAPERSTIERKLPELRKKFINLRQQKQQLLNENKRLIHQMAFINKDSEKELFSLKQMYVELKKLYNKISIENEQMQALLKQAKADSKRLEKQQYQLIELQGLIKDLKIQKKDLPPQPAIAYILSSDRKLPWIIDFTLNSLRIASKDGFSSIIEIKADTVKKRVQRFLEWAKTQDASTYYFVILIKPSMLEQAYGLAAKLRKMGFDIGTDLIPENWKPF